MTEDRGPSILIVSLAAASLALVAGSLDGRELDDLCIVSDQKLTLLEM